MSGGQYDQAAADIGESTQMESIERLEHMIRGLKKDKRDIETKILDCLAEIEEEKKKMAQHQATTLQHNAEFQKEKEKLNQQFTNLKKEVNTRDTRLNEMGNTVEVLTKENSKIQEDFDNHRKQCKSFAKIRDDLKNYLRTKSFRNVKGKFTALETELALTRGEKEELEENLEYFRKKWNRVAQYMAVIPTQKVNASERADVSDRHSNVGGAPPDKERRLDNGRLRDQEARNRMDSGPVPLSEVSILNRNDLQQSSVVENGSRIQNFSGRDSFECHQIFSSEDALTWRRNIASSRISALSPTRQRRLLSPDDNEQNSSQAVPVHNTAPRIPVIMRVEVAQAIANLSTNLTLNQITRFHAALVQAYRMMPPEGYHLVAPHFRRNPSKKKDMVYIDENSGEFPDQCEHDSFSLESDDGMDLD